MGLAAQLAGKSLVGRPGRTLFSILGVALGIAIVVAVFTLDHVSVLSRTRWLTDDYGADLEVQPTADLADPRAALLKLEGVAGVAAYFQNDVGVRADATDGRDDVPTTVRLVALESESAPSLGILEVEFGSLLAPRDPEGVLLGAALAEALGVGPGDRVWLAPPLNAPASECFEGVERELESGGPDEIVTEPFVVRGILARSGVGRYAQGRVAVVDYLAGRRLYRGRFVESRFWVQRTGQVDLEDLEANLMGSFTFERNERRAVGQMADERAFRNGVRMAGLFALLLGLFVIFHTLSMSLLERVREVGTLVALGSTRWQVARVFFLEALVIALSSAVLGILGGLALSFAMLAVGITTLGVRGGPVGPFEVPWATVGWLTGLGVLIALVGSVYPVLRARGANVVGALRGDRSDAGATKGFQVLAIVLLCAVLPGFFFLLTPLVGAADPALMGAVLLALGGLGLLVGLPLAAPRVVARIGGWLVGPLVRRFPLAGLVAHRAMLGSPARIGASVAAIALVTAAFTGLRGMTSSLRGEVEEWGAVAIEDKVFVQGLPQVTLEELERALAGVPGVLGIERGDVRAYVNFLLEGIEPEQLERYGPLAGDAELQRRFRDEQTILVSSRLAKQRGLVPGDQLFVRTSGHGVQSFEVLAITDEVGYFIHPDERAYAVAHPQHLERFFCLDTDTLTSAAIRMGSTADPIAAYLAVQQAFPGAGALKLRLGTTILGQHLDDIDRDFILFDIILVLSALLAGLGVLNGQLLSALEREKELGVLRALGATDEQLGGSVWIESVAVGLTGGVIGLVVGASLTPLLLSALRSLSGLDLPNRTAGGWAPAFLVGAVCLALTAGVAPVRRIRRTDAVRAVRTGG
ncbi:MAG: FtsX-like permease family protein [Planctomycetota bacterium]